MSFIASEGLEDLGDWIKRRLAGADLKQEKAVQVLLGLNRTVDELREQWELQKKAQLSTYPSKPITAITV